MSEYRLETGQDPEVHVLAHGRLLVQGWDQDAVEAPGAGEDCRISQEDDAVHVTAEDRLDLRVPHGASIFVTGSDEVVIRDVAGTIQVEQAGGGITLRDVGPSSVRSVGDDLTARSVSGGLTAGQVGRYLNVKDVAGDLKVDYSDSHANVRGVAGDLSLESGGNVSLVADIQSGQSVSVKAAGVITCRVGQDLDAHVTISSGGPVSVRVGEVAGGSSEGHYDHVFGAGEGLLKLEADGPVTLTGSRGGSQSPDIEIDLGLAEELGDLGAGIGQQISAQLEVMEEALESGMANFSNLFSNLEIAPEKAERIQQHTQEKIERAQEKIRRAQERAARKIADAQRRAAKESRRSGRRSRGRSFKINLGDLKRTASGQSQPVSDEERLMILNMVAENKISLEEAEKLLAALEGN